MLIFEEFWRNDTMSAGRAAARLAKRRVPGAAARETL
jgi:hypothetical protein